MTEGRKKSSGQWRDRYLKKLQQIETLETRHAEEVEQLRRALVSVSLVVDGIDADLRHSLAVMRRIFRGDEKDRELDSLLKKVQVQARSVRERNTPQQSIYQLQRLTRQLELLAPSRKLKKSLQKFSRSLDNDLASLMQTPAFLKTLASLQEQLVCELQAAGGTPQPSEPFWQRLFGSNQSDDADRTEEAHGEIELPVLDSDVEEDQHSAVAEDALSAERARDDLLDSDEGTPRSSTPGYSSVGHEVSRVVQNLIEQLSIPKNGSYQHLRLQQLLMRSQNWYELIPLLENTSALVMLCIRHGRTEFTGYLNKINQQLLDYISGLEDARDGVSFTLESSEKLTNQLEGNITHLETSMAEATSLDQLKEMVGDHLHTLLQEVDEYKQDLSQSRESQEKLAALGEKVQLLENQTQTLRTDLVQEQRRALRDALTGLPNRLAYDEQVQREMARCRRYQQELTLVVADIDFFKRINDQYGHLAGDKLLRIFARQLLGGLREADFIARYGGEEFALLFPNTSQEEAVQVVEKIRQRLVDTPFRYKDEQLDIRASYGIATWNESVESHEQLFEQADIALYSAKEKGRDRHCIYSKELPQKRCSGNEKASES